MAAVRQRVVIDVLRIDPARRQVHPPLPERLVDEDPAPDPAWRDAKAGIALPADHGAPAVRRPDLLHADLAGAPGRSAISPGRCGLRRRLRAGFPARGGAAAAAPRGPGRRSQLVGSSPAQATRAGGPLDHRRAARAPRAEAPGLPRLGRELPGLRMRLNGWSWNADRAHRGTATASSRSSRPWPTARLTTPSERGRSAGSLARRSSASWSRSSARLPQRCARRRRG